MKKYFVILIVIIFLPTMAGATGPFSLPFYSSQSINAYVDLDSRFDWVYDYAHPTPWQEGVVGWPGLGYAYDGHKGTDYNLSSGTKVAAAAPGTVTSIADNYGNTYPGGPVIFGNYVKMSHSGNFETIYGHLLTGSLQVATSSYAGRGQYIAKSGNTGYSTGAHLHFEVRYNGVATDSYQNNYWKNNPPKLPTDVSGTIDDNTVWEPGTVYTLDGSVTLAASASLHVQPGTIVKFKLASSLAVNGELAVNGTSASRSYFTSYKDDTVGGDTNGDGSSTTPSSGDWYQMRFNSGSSASMDYLVVRYGGNLSSGIYADIYGNGGTLNIFNSTIASSSYRGIVTDSGTVNISNNTIQDNGDYGVYAYGTGNLNLDNNTFIDNGTAAGSFSYGSGKVITTSGNTASGSGKRGFLVSGYLYADNTWAQDIPYIISSPFFTIPAGYTLTLDPGAILKFDNVYMLVNGRLNSQGASGSQVYFTSLKDDSIGGDTNNAGGSPAGGDWKQIQFEPGSTGSISYSTIRYGGNGYGAYSNIFLNSGGNVDVSYSTIASSQYYGFGIYSAGSLNVTNSLITANPNYGIYNNSTATVSAEYNYWGDSSGPYNATSNPSGTGNAVSNYVDFIPWNPSWP